MSARTLSGDVVITLLDRHAPFAPCALVPELSAWHTDDEVALWQALEAEAGGPVEVPYFAIAWPSAQVVARTLLDGRIEVRGLKIADVGCGSGLVACAAMKAGARSALALDVDARAAPAARELGRRHGVVVEARTLDPLERPADVDAEVVFCADLVSRQAQRAPFAAAVTTWRSRNVRIVLADSGRPFFDPQGLPLLFAARVPLTSAVDGAGEREVRVFGA